MGKKIMGSWLRKIEWFFGSILSYWLKINTLIIRAVSASDIEGSINSKTASETTDPVTCILLQSSSPDVKIKVNLGLKFTLNETIRDWVVGGVKA